MPYINDIPVSDLKVFDSIADAPVGTLVQIARASLPHVVQPTETGEAEVGLRSNFDAAGQQFLGVVILEGPLAGLFLRDEQISNAPAVNVDALACIALHDPTPHPFNAMNAAVSHGDVCKGMVRDTEPFLCMAIVPLPDNPDAPAPKPGRQVRLVGPQRGHIVNATTRVFLGRAIVLSVNLHTTGQ